ncbi:MAG: hypothetical protein J0L72_09915 [Armatimonadetes bacterium]|nr:hypothetical protein [Armatimonadota bacterium]
MQKLGRMLTFSLVLTTSVAFAQTPKVGQIYRELRLPEVVNHGQVAQLGPGGTIIGPWQSFGPQAQSGRAVWEPAFDTMSFNPNSGTAYTNIYGQTGGFFRFSNAYKNPFYCQDIQSLAPTVFTGSAKRFATDIVWNPGGTEVRSGSARLAMAVFTATNFGSIDSGLSFTSPIGTPVGSGYYGLVIDWGIQANGWRTYDANLSSTTYSIPLPGNATANTPAAILVVIGTINASGQFVLNPSTFAMQPTLDTMATPIDPNFPGQNLSSSGPLQWDDDGGSILAPSFNGVHDNLVSTSNAFSELYSYDWTSTNDGFVQSAVSLFVNAAGNRDAGIVGGTPQPFQVTMQYFLQNNAGTYATDGTGHAISLTASSGVKPSGHYDMDRITAWFSTMGQGFNLHAIVRVPGYLARVVRNAPSFAPSFDLIGGDIDGDNEIGSSDYDAVIAAFGARYGNPRFNPVADIDRDGEVGSSDFDVVVTNFGLSGDRIPVLP